MNDKYRKIALKSIKDAAYLQEDVMEEYDVAMPDQFIGQFAMALYQHRVQEWRKNVMEAEQQAAYPDNDGQRGRY